MFRFITLALLLVAPALGYRTPPPGNVLAPAPRRAGAAKVGRCVGVPCVPITCAYAYVRVYAESDSPVVHVVQV